MKKSISLVAFAVILFSSQGFGAPIVSVTGQCNKKVQPDRASIVMWARTIEKDATTASKRVTAQYETLRKEVLKLQLKDQQLKTDNYSVNMEWDYSNNKRTLRGYNASMGLRIETSELARIGELLMLSSKLGLQDVGSPTTYLSPDLFQTEYESCLKVAVQSARGKAEKMAAAAGLTIKDLASLNETKPNEGGPSPLPFAADMRSAKTEMAEAAPNIEVAPETMQVTIFATYNLK